MEYYDEIEYDELHREEQERKMRIILSNLQIRESDRVLDVGCGTGISSEGFRDVIGIDPSEKLLKKARIKTVLGKCEELPFPDKSFDIVLSVTSIHHIDLDKGLDEIERVAKRDIVISVLKKAGKFSEIEKAIRKKFDVVKVVDEGIDTIFFAKV